MYFDETVRIQRPVEDVFAFLLDVQDHAVGPGSPVVAMAKEPAGPTGPATRWREVVRLAPGLHLTVDSVVTALAANRLLALRFRGGHMRGDIRYTLTADNGATLLRQQERMRTVGVLTPLGGVMGRALARRLHRRLTAIRSALEAVG